MKSIPVKELNPNILEILDESIPRFYTEIPSFIWLDIIKNIIKVLEKEEDLLRSYKYEEFN